MDFLKNCNINKWEIAAHRLINTHSGGRPLLRSFVKNKPIFIRSFAKSRRVKRALKKTIKAKGTKRFSFGFLVITAYQFYEWGYRLPRIEREVGILRNLKWLIRHYIFTRMCQQHSVKMKISEMSPLISYLKWLIVGEA